MLTLLWFETERKRVAPMVMEAEGPPKYFFCTILGCEVFPFSLLPSTPICASSSWILQSPQLQCAGSGAGCAFRLEFESGALGRAVLLNLLWHNKCFTKCALRCRLQPYWSTLLADLRHCFAHGDKPICLKLSTQPLDNTAAICDFSDTRLLHDLVGSFFNTTT